MIVDAVRGDVLESPNPHIAFAVNAEGINDAGFAGLVASRFWKKLAKTGQKPLGDTLTHQTNGKTFHALVCHELQGSGWDQTPKLVEECLNRLNVPDTEIIAVILMGSGMIGRMGGADVYSILGGMARSTKRIAIYTL